MELRIGERIKELRRNKNITQNALGGFLNVSPQTISKWENEVTLPDIQMLPRIAEYFGISIDYLFDYKPKENIEMRIESFCGAINHIIELIGQSRRNGLLALENHYNECNDLEHYGLMILLNGIRGQTLEICMRNMSANGYGTGDRALDECLIAGISGLSDAMPQAICKEIMLSFVPKEINERVREIVDGRNRSEIESFKRRLISGQLKYVITGTLEFIRELPNPEIQRLLSGCKTENLTNGLFGASGVVCQRIFDNLYSRLENEILYDMYEIDRHMVLSESIIQKNQQEIVDAFAGERNN